LYRGDIEIKGFTNHIQKQWVRYYRQIEREVNETIWDGDEDVLDLRILFGEKIYIPEKWD